MNGLWIFVLLFLPVLSDLPSVAVREKKKIKTDFVGQEFIWLIHPRHNPSTKDAKIGTKAEQEPGSMNCSRDHRGLLFVGFIIACSVCLLKQCKTTCIGAAPPTVDSAFLCQSLIKRIPIGLPAGQLYGVVLSTEVPYSWITETVSIWQNLRNTHPYYSFKNISASFQHSAGDAILHNLFVSPWMT